MHRLDAQKPMLLIAASLSFLAGYVDALGFLQLGGVFVSFMSGNSTRLGIAGTGGEAFPVLMLAGIIALFVGGVIAGTLLGQRAPLRRSRIITGFVCGMLIGAGVCDYSGYSMLAIACATMAMGAVNTLFEKDGEVSVALTYMTGTLVRMGQRIAAALSGGGAPFGWVKYFMLWAGLVCGAIAGAWCYSLWGFAAIWLAAIAALVVFIGVSRTEKST